MRLVVVQRPQGSHGFVLLPQALGGRAQFRLGQSAFAASPVTTSASLPRWSVCISPPSSVSCSPNCSA